jgi:5-oxoprolinase (ATP-hydrolysing)
MTNSRLTDPEVLEWRYPVLVESFEVRKNSGGVGRNRGGNGVIRRIRFLESMTAAILSGRRITEPFGLDGGQNGKSGETWVERADGSRTKLGFADSTEVSRGDTIVITTPGGGGFGAPN